ncbi:hypothetical protein Lal_00018330 [Lupinus albus]|nr:hypothetical protein Lal_00018330 [Lupinus albus]
MERERKSWPHHTSPKLWPLGFDTSTRCCSKIGEGKRDGGEGNHLRFASIAAVVTTASSISIAAAVPESKDGEVKARVVSKFSENGKEVYDQCRL